MRKAWQLALGLFLGLFLGVSGSSLAQKLSRTTPMAGGPPASGFLGDYDSGLVNLPTPSVASLTTSTILVQNIYCHNTGTIATVTITNTAGTAYVNAFSMAANTSQQFINGGKGIQMVGIKWAGSTGTINCQIAGYQ